MRFVISPVNASPWYDRNPTYPDAGWTGAVQNDGAGTVRWSYTVPANRRAAITALAVTAHCTTAGAAGAWCRAGITIQPSGGTARQVCMAVVDAGTLGAVFRASIDGPVILGTGDIVQCTTVTSDAVSVTQVFTGGVFLEFDA